MHTIRVRALANVLGMFAGNEYDVEPSARVEKMLKWGHLECLDDLGPEVSDDDDKV